MSGQSSIALAEEIIGLLAAEADDLRLGKLHQMDAVSRQTAISVKRLKSTLAVHADKGDLPSLTKTLNALQVRALANEALLAAAVQGVRSAQRRLAEIHQSHANVGAYSPLGQSLTIRDDLNTRSNMV